MTDRILLREVASEAWRNLVTGAGRALPLTLVLAAGWLLAVDLELASTAQLMVRAETYVAGGGSTYALITDGLVDPARCDALVQTGLVDRAGAARRVSDEVFSSMPANPVPSFEVTPGMMTLLAPQIGGASVLYSRALAKTVAPGLLGDDVGRWPRADGVFEWPADGRTPVFEYAQVGLARPAGAFDSCWVRATDPTANPTLLLRSVLTAEPDGPAVSAGQVNGRWGETLTTHDEFVGRTSRWAWLAGALFALILAIGAVRLRALEIATSASVGVDRASLILQHTVEAACWGCSAAVPVLAYALVRAQLLATGSPSQLVAVAGPVILAGLGGVLSGTMVGVWWVSRRGVDAYLRSRAG